MRCAVWATNCMKGNSGKEGGTQPQSIGTTAAETMLWLSDNGPWMQHCVKHGAQMVTLSPYMYISTGANLSHDRHDQWFSSRERPECVLPQQMPARPVQ